MAFAYALKLSLASLWRAIRASEWWGYKLAPVLGTAYATAYVSKLSMISLWPVVLLTLAALAPCAAYVSVINDVTGGRDARLLETVSRTGAGIVLMHMLGEPKTMQDDPRYDDVVAEVNEFLRERIEAAVFAGIPEERTCIDPGIGFGKTVEHNLALLRAVPALRMLGAAVMVGASRKGIIGTLTGVENPAARLEGSLAVAVLAAAHGADLVRVHDVEATVRALKVADAVVREPLP